MYMSFAISLALMSMSIHQAAHTITMARAPPSWAVSARMLIGRWSQWQANYVAHQYRAWLLCLVVKAAVQRRQERNQAAGASKKEQLNLGGPLAL
ncbi:unnamed protein product [Amoebophrya sp. A25]|nr:unnamed protein product [Amoebophrya sp. A25]|eukprot:GSA25T00015847001.1